MTYGNRTRVRRGSDESARHQEQLGQQLAVEKEACFASGMIWRTYVKEEFGLSRERADELIRVGLGVLSVDDYRNVKKLARRVYRQRNNLNQAAKNAFLCNLKGSTDASQKAKVRAVKTNFSPEDVAELRSAVSDAISSLQEIFDILK